VLQTLPLNNERVSIPELLFHPGDLGVGTYMSQAGVPELIQQSIEAAPENMRPLLYSNILVCGGNAQIPNFAERVYVVSPLSFQPNRLTCHKYMFCFLF
jgi:actin-related protein 6